MHSIPSSEQCLTALDRIEDAQRGTEARGVVSEPCVLALYRLQSAQTMIGRIAAYREVGSVGPRGYMDSAIEDLRHAIAIIESMDLAAPVSMERGR